jgi:hypothetical protein
VAQYSSEGIISQFLTNGLNQYFDSVIDAVKNDFYAVVWNRAVSYGIEFVCDAVILPCAVAG